MKLDWPLPDASSDGTHAAGGEPWWREGWYFEFFDPAAKLQFQAYQGVFPNAGTGDLNTAVFHRGRRVHQLSKMDFNVPPEPRDERLCFGPMKLEEIEALRQWRVSYDSDEFYAELDFTAVHPPFSWADLTRPAERTGSQHFDQLGRYTGSAWVDGEQLRIDTLGFRDRMWGWGRRKHWSTYLVTWAAFGEDCVANVAVQRFDDGQQSLAGYLCLDGECSLLREAEITAAWHPGRWKTLSSTETSVLDALGRRFVFSGRPQGILDTGHRWPQRHDHMLFSVGEYQHAERYGYGVMNWAFRRQADQFRRLQAKVD